VIGLQAGSIGLLSLLGCRPGLGQWAGHWSRQLRFTAPAPAVRLHGSVKTFRLGGWQRSKVAEYFLETVCALLRTQVCLFRQAC
jgi:hypothetical protein